MLLDPVVQALVYPVSWWIFVSGWDEVFVDACFAYHTTFGRESWGLAIKKLDETPEKRMAMFVPCWREFDVIENMIDHNIAAIDYRNYDIFLGVYPNDPRTLEKAVLLEERYQRVHKSICPEDGPTNKADCLNWIFQRMKLEEEKDGARYEVIVQHDAEDIVHPKSFKLINRLTSTYDMVQIPVFPLEMTLQHFTHGTYCDEFAEFQIKDIHTRQLIGGFVPSAGVGTAFRRDALEEIAAHYRNQIFNVNTLTEDYEIGLKFKRHGKKQMLVRKAIPLVGRNGHGAGNGRANGKANGNGHTNGNGHARGNGKVNGNGQARANGKANGAGHANGKANGNGSAHPVNLIDRIAAWIPTGNTHRVEFIATREYFPHRFRDAVRQKSRWVTGIALQTWEQMGWAGSLRQVYWYWRDRKGLIGNVVTLLSNIIFIYCALMWAGDQLLDTGWSFSNVFPASGVIWWLLPFNTFFIFERAFYRIYSVNKVYGPRQAVGSVLRVPWANLINFTSTLYALYTFVMAKVIGVEVKWRKTAHAFPTREQLTEYKRRLGDLLLENRLISAFQLEDALAVQRETGERLGEILIRKGYITELEFTRMLGRQQNIEVREVDPYTIDLEVLRRVPRPLALEHQVIPVSFLNHSGLLVASPEIPTEEEVAAMSAATGFQVTVILTTQNDFAFALERAYARLNFDPSGKVRLGDALVQSGHLSQHELDIALREQKRLRKPLGEVLLAKGWVTEELLHTVLSQGTGREFRRMTKADVRPDAAALIPKRFQRMFQAVPFETSNGTLRVAVGAPLPDANLWLFELVTGKRIELVYTTVSDVAAILG